MALVRCTRITQWFVLTFSCSSEFLVADLALSALLVPTFTVASASVISPVLERHPPSVIITNAELLQHLLELIYDAHESEHHTIVVTGDVSGVKLPKVDHVKILMWDDIEADGAAATKAVLPVPGSSSTSAALVAAP